MDNDVHYIIIVAMQWHQHA